MRKNIVSRPLNLTLHGKRLHQIRSIICLGVDVVRFAKAFCLGVKLRSADCELHLIQKIETLPSKGPSLRSWNLSLEKNTHACGNLADSPFRLKYCRKGGRGRAGQGGWERLNDERVASPTVNNMSCENHSMMQKRNIPEISSRSCNSDLAKPAFDPP